MNRRHFVSTVALAGCCASTALAVQHPLERGGTFRMEHFVIQRPLDLFKPVTLVDCDITLDGGCLNLWTKDFAFHRGLMKVLSLPPGKFALNVQGKQGGFCLRGTHIICEISPGWL